MRQAREQAEQCASALLTKVVHPMAHCATLPLWRTLLRSELGEAAQLLQARQSTLPEQRSAHDTRPEEQPPQKTWIVKLMQGS